MVSVGDAGAWAVLFPQGLVPEILDVIVEAWATTPKPAPDADEVPTTRGFRSQIVQHKNLRKLPVRVERECVEDDLATGTELGRIDIRFTPAGSAREEVYLAFECKRVNAIVRKKKRALFAEYVSMGMLRFSSGQYASAMTDGGMIAYVLDGNSPAAMTGIESNLPNHQAALKMTHTGFAASSLRPLRSEIRETRHNFGRAFVMHHIFLV